MIAGEVRAMPAPATNSGKRKSRTVTLKASKEKKSSWPKSSSLSHPPYFQMIKEAILALKERGGSSPYAIAKYMEEHIKGVLPANFKKILAIQLKNSAARGKLVKVKASFKLSESSKKDANSVKEKNTVKKNLVVNKDVKKRKASPLGSTVGDKKKSSVSKVSKKVKKMVPEKPKQLKSIKSLAEKKMKKGN